MLGGKLATGDRREKEEIPVKFCRSHSLSTVKSTGREFHWVFFFFFFWVWRIFGMWDCWESEGEGFFIIILWETVQTSLGLHPVLGQKGSIPSEPGSSHYKLMAHPAPPPGPCGPTWATVELFICPLASYFCWVSWYAVGQVKAQTFYFGVAPVIRYAKTDLEDCMVESKCWKTLQKCQEFPFNLLKRERESTF